jgi:hypothetical protein
MTPERLDKIRTAHLSPCADERLALNAIAHRVELVGEIDRLRDAYERLAACVGRLDFDRSESALPETQEQWIEFVREIDERAQSLIEAEEESR